MKKRFITFPLFLALVLSLTFHASGAEPDGALVEIKRWTYSDADASFSCDAKLSGAELKGHVFAVLCAESGKVKQVKKYAADETRRICLPGTDTTDYIRVIWTDERYAPLAEPKILRMRDNGADACRDFEERMKNLRDNDLTQSGDLTCLLVSCAEPLNWEEYGVDYSLDEVIPGPNNFYILQFNNSVRAKRCKEQLEHLPSVRRVDFDSKIVAEPDEIPPDNARLSGEEETEKHHHSWGVEETGIGAYAEDLQKRGLDKEIIVAVVDSGVAQKHSFLEDRLLPGYDFFEEDDIPQDERIHGTHVAGIIADCTPGLNVKILPVRVLSAKGESQHSIVASGVYYAVAHGADIINLSLRFKIHDFWLDEAIAYALSKNVAVVVAAGNDNSDAQNSCPAHVRDCLTVAAIERNGGILKRYEISNYGKAADMSAPGADIEGCVPENDFDVMSGTSMAAPHVSAAAALLKCEYGKNYTPGEISDALKGAAKRLPEDAQDNSWKLYRRNHADASWADFLGAGFLDMRPFFLKCTVTFQDNAAPPITVAYGTGVTLPFPASVKDGYAFAAWNTRVDGAGKSYQVGEMLTVTEDMTLYAQWSAIQRTFIFDANDGSGRIQRIDLPVTSGTSITAPENPFPRADYEIISWNTKADGSGVSYKPGQTLTVAKGLTLYLYAQWKEILDRKSSYAMLYSDGELTFQRGNAANPAKTLIASYPLPTTENSSLEQRAAWYAHRDKIRTVSFADAIQPVSTALWFYGCANLLEIRNLENLDASRVTDMSQMFSSCGALTFLDLSALDTSSAVSMQQMFFDCTGLKTLDLTGWNTANVTNMADMFHGCAALETLYASTTFTTGKVSNSVGMFDDCAALVGGCGIVYDPAHTDKAYARLDGGLSAPGYFTDKSAQYNNIYAVLYADGELVFQNSNRTESARSLTDVYKVEGSYFYRNYAPWYEQRDNVVTVTFADRIQPNSTAYWFYECAKLKDIRLPGNLNAVNVTSMKSMFACCGKLYSLDLSGFDTSKVTDMSYMFGECSSLHELNLSGFDTSKVDDMSGMFQGCGNLYALDLSGFDTSKTDNMLGMFCNCRSLYELNLSGFDTSNVTDMSGMFGSCRSLYELNLSGFNTSNVTDMSYIVNDIDFRLIHGYIKRRRQCEICACGN